MKYILLAILALTVACTEQEKEMKVGAIEEVGETKTWVESAWFDKAPACPDGAVASKPCDGQLQGCKLPNKKGLECKVQKTYKVTGYVYEKLDLGFKPLEGVEITQTWFAGCIVGFCDEWKVAVTDKDGKYEFLTSDVKDTMKAGKEGFYGYCTNDPRMPISLKNGQSIIEGPGKKMLPLTLQKLTPEACK